MSTQTNAQWQYQQALWELSDLVMRRNQSLLHLGTLATMPVGLRPDSGMVAEFDTRAARELLAHIDHQTEQINDAIAKTNHFAGAAGAPSVIWKRIPVFPNGHDGH